MVHAGLGGEVINPQAIGAAKHLDLQKRGRGPGKGSSRREEPSVWVSRTMLCGEKRLRFRSQCVAKTNNFIMGGGGGVRKKKDLLGT